MPGVILGIVVENKTSLGRDLRRELGRVQKAVMLDTGRKFAMEHIAPHFGPANRSRFKHEKRNKVYEKEIKKKKGQGQGKYVDNTLSGRSFRQTMATVRVTGTKDRCVVRAAVPAYFAKPFVGSFMKPETDRNGRTRNILKRITRQPDKMKELGAIDRSDVDALTQFALRRGRKYWREAKAAHRKRIV